MRRATKRIILCGLGNVGKAFFRLLHERRWHVTEKYGLGVELAAVVDSGGAAVSDKGSLPLGQLLAHIDAGGPVGLRIVDLPDEYEPGAHRWCFYGLNVLGDPATDVWTGQPTPIAASHEHGIDRGALGFTVETDAPGSTGSLYEGGTCLGTGTAMPDGIMTIHLADTIPGAIDSLDLTVTGHDRLVYRSRIAVTTYSGNEDRAPRLALFQNSPNPFNPSTTIRFTLGSAGHVDLRAYDAAGREVAVIASGRMDAGAHEIAWNASGLASGVYFYLLRAEGRMVSRKAVLLR